MSEFGDRLRAAREAKGLTYKQVEEAIRIRQVFIQAMEEERFADLPDPVYARGFIRTYAHYVGLDSEALLQTYRTLVGAPTVTVPQVLDEPLMRPLAANLWARVWRWVLCVAFVVLLGWGAYRHFVLHSDPWPLSLLQRSVTPPAVTLPTPPPTVALQTLVPPTATPTLMPTSTPTVRPSATRLPSPSATIAPTRTLGAASSATEPVGAIQVRAVVSATTYLEVMADDAPVFTGTLLAGQERTFSADARLALRVGNAGGLQLIVNGVTAPPLGTPGQVVEVVYTPDTLPKP